MKSYKRKIILINPKFQLKVIAFFVSLSALSIGSFYGACIWFFYQFHQMGKDLGLPADHIFYRFLSVQQAHLNYIFIGVSLVVLSILIVGGAILSHRIAGPIYRLCQHFKGISEEKEIRPLSFREGDFFQEITEAVNPVLKKMNDKNLTKKAG